MQALVGREGDDTLHRRADAIISPPGGIDYYSLLDRRSAKMEIGDSVIYGFRVQAFATRAYITVLRGLSRGEAKVAGIYDVSGRKA